MALITMCTWQSNEVYSLPMTASLITKPIGMHVCGAYYVSKHLSLIWHEIASGRRGPESSPSVRPSLSWSDDSWECDMTSAHLSGPVTALVARQRPSCPSSRHLHRVAAAGIKPTIRRRPPWLHCPGHHRGMRRRPLDNTVAPRRRIAIATTTIDDDYC